MEGWIGKPEGTPLDPSYPRSSIPHPSRKSLQLLRLQEFRIHGAGIRNSDAAETWNPQWT
jgi:hypothetical protein